MRTGAHHRPLAVIAVLALVVSACGTMLSDEEFLAATEGETIVEEGAAGTVDLEGLTDEEIAALEEQGVIGPGGSGVGGGGGASTGGGGTGDGDASGAGPSAQLGANTASDVGVTESSIKVGNITAIGGALGPEAFSPMLHGARTYFQAINEKGGINGRKIEFVTCDDREDPSQNRNCVAKLVQDEKVFALVSNSTLAYAGASDVNEAGVPDVGGQPIGNEYYKYPWLWTILGAPYPRTGEYVGQKVDGKPKLFVQTGTYRHFKQKIGVSRGAVFFYFIPVSRQAGLFIAQGAEQEGIDVVFTPNDGAGRNPADPSYDADVIQMQQERVDGIWNAIDIAGFQRLCDAMDRFGFRVKANVSTIQGWSQKVGDDFSSPCRNNIFVNGSSRPYSETNHPAVKEFRAAMAKFDPNFRMHQWALEGWAGARMFRDAVESQGAAPTRAGMKKFLDALRGYEAGGLINPITFEPDPNRKGAQPNCFSMAKWSDAEGTFVPSVKTFTCPSTTYYSYDAIDA